MNEIESALINTRKNAVDVMKDLGISVLEISEIEQCSSCSIWVKFTQLIEDLDGLPICKECLTFYGK